MGRVPVIIIISPRDRIVNSDLYGDNRRFKIDVQILSCTTWYYYDNNSRLSTPGSLPTKVLHYSNIVQVEFVQSRS